MLKPRSWRGGARLAICRTIQRTWRSNMSRDLHSLAALRKVAAAVRDGYRHAATHVYASWSIGNVREVRCQISACRSGQKIVDDIIFMELVVESSAASRLRYEYLPDEGTRLRL